MTSRAVSTVQVARGLLIASAMGWGVSAADASSASAGLAANVRALIGDAACSGDGQCRTVAVGAKACGGPEAYLAWSTLRTDEAALVTAVAEYSAKRRADVSDSGLASNCALVTDPGAYCAQVSPAAPDAKPVSKPVCRLRSSPFGSRQRAE